MKRILPRIIVLLLLFYSAAVFSQESTNKQQQPKSTRAHKREARKNWKEKRRLDHIEKKKIKAHHKQFQTKSTFKRMKKDRKKSERNNQDKREFFLKRWFSKK